jgi:hypothetical protein
VRWQVNNARSVELERHIGVEELELISLLARNLELFVPASGDT